MNCWRKDVERLFFCSPTPPLSSKDPALPGHHRPRGSSRQTRGRIPSPLRRRGKRPRSSRFPQSHSRTAPSDDPETAHRPSDVNATDQTPPTVPAQLAALLTLQIPQPHPTVVRPRDPPPPSNQPTESTIPSAQLAAPYPQIPPHPPPIDPETPTAHPLNPPNRPLPPAQLAAA